jgi:hypothetical protein
MNLATYSREATAPNKNITANVTLIDFSFRISQWQVPGQVTFLEIARSCSSRDAVFGVGREIWRRNQNHDATRESPEIARENSLPPTPTTT